jgi:hypothetical protein
LISLIKVVLREIRIQDFQGDYLPMEALLADFPASDYAVVDRSHSPISLIDRGLSLTPALYPFS